MALGTIALNSLAICHSLAIIYLYTSLQDHEIDLFMTWPLRLVKWAVFVRNGATYGIQPTEWNCLYRASEIGSQKCSRESRQRTT